MKFVLKIALRYIFAKSNDRFISFISGFCLLGITLGVASLIVVMSIMNGFRHELTKCIIGLNGHIIIGSSDASLREKIITYPFVQKVGRLIEGQGLMSFYDGSSGVVVKGLAPDELSIKPQILEKLDGHIQDFNAHSNAILIGKQIAMNLNINVGDQIKLVFPQTVSSIFGAIPKTKEFKVVGIFNSGHTEYDSLNVIIPINTAEKIFGDEKAFFEVYTDDPENVQLYTKIMYRDLADQIEYINNWKIVNNATLDALRIEKVAMSTVLSLIIIVAAFNIISSLFMLVKDKTKDIAILRTIGASKFSIMLIFMINGLFIGACGTALGITIGQLIAVNINTIKGYLESFSGIKIFDSAVYFLYNLPAKLESGDVWFVLCMSLSLCFLATIYPAYRAAKLNPVDAIRYE
jgi:lipoprotein-releasing system permease protein